MNNHQREALFTGLIGATGVFSLVGVSHPWAWATPSYMLLALTGSLIALPVNRLGSGIASSIALLGGTLIFGYGVAPLPASIALVLTLLSLVQTWFGERQSDRDTIIWIALLQLALAHVWKSDWSTWLATGCWLFLAPIVMSRSNLRTGGPAGLIASMSLAAMFFLFSPGQPPETTSPNSGPTSPTTASVGFSADMRLGDLRQLHLDSTEVIRAWPDLPDEASRYLRGAILTRFDGRTWSSMPAPSPSISPASSIRIESSKAAGDYAFAPGQITDISSTTTQFQPSGAGDWLTASSGEKNTYIATYKQPTAPTDLASLEPYLELPESLDPRIRELAASLSQNGTLDQETTAQNIQAWMDEHLNYGLEAQPDQADDPLADFLFASQRGHCEYFATAATVLLRASGHPARIVTGYALPEGQQSTLPWRLQKLHGHGWVEVIDGQGHWVVWDPTPPISVSGDNGTPVASTLMPFSDPAGVFWLSPFAALILFVGFGLWLRTRPTSVRDVHRRARAFLASRITPPPSHLPPLAAAHCLRIEHPELATDLLRLVDLLYQTEFEDVGSDNKLPEAKRIYREIRRKSRHLSSVRRG